MNEMTPPAKSDYHVAAQQFKIPIRVLYRLNSIGVIDQPLTDVDRQFLTSLRKIWGKSWFLRSQISRLSKSQREAYLFRRPELTEKWERWTYSRYFHNDIRRGTDNRMLNPEERILIDQMIDDLEEIFRIKVTPRILRRIKEIRTLAQRDKSRLKAKEMDILPIPPSQEEQNRLHAELMEYIYS